MTMKNPVVLEHLERVNLLVSAIVQTGFANGNPDVNNHRRIIDDPNYKGRIRGNH